MTFWIVAGAMIIVALVFVLPPLFRQSRVRTVDRDKLNITVHKDQLAELEADLRNEVISAEHYEQSRQDLMRNLLGDVESTPQDKQPAGDKPGAARGTAIVVAVAIPVLAVAMYSILSQMELTHGPQPMESAQGGGISPEIMVQRLAERLKSNPNDGEGWARLGLSYGVLGRYKEAAEAYAKALPLMGDNPQLLADYAEVMALSHEDQHLAGQPTELFQKALKLDPDNQKALWLAGMASFQKEDYRSAINYWQRLVASLPPNSEGLDTVKNHIAEAQALAANPVTPK
ncbi:MAG: c-type cytochrome biogenesis protein CcmI [Gammaproteobacteria bacterium]|nr:c-type cytochrome biogenesis protein CcmI [Gammaproteobacteria bacterium]